MKADGRDKVIMVKPDFVLIRNIAHGLPPKQVRAVAARHASAALQQQKMGHQRSNNLAGLSPHSVWLQVRWGAITEHTGVYDHDARTTSIACSVAGYPKVPAVHVSQACPVLTTATQPTSNATESLVRMYFPSLIRPTTPKHRPC